MVTSLINEAHAEYTGNNDSVDDTSDATDFNDTLETISGLKELYERA